MKAVKERLTQIKLRMNETKSKIVYCKDYRRKAKFENNSFKFLGYSFQPREMKKKRGNFYQIFSPAISTDKRTSIQEAVRQAVHWSDSSQSIEKIADRLNSKIRGWINYFSLFGKRGLVSVMMYIDRKLAKWVQRKQGQRSIRAAVQEIRNVKMKQPRLFYHWEKGYVENYQAITRAV
jgi:hypothetical protein